MKVFDPSAAAPKDSGIFGLPYEEADAKIILLPVPFEATTSYRRGTAQGPEAILTASRQIDLFDLETGRPYEVGLWMAPLPEQVLAWNQQAKNLADPIIELGGQIHDIPSLQAQLDEVNRITTQVKDWVYTKTEGYLTQGKIVGIIGGDHSVPLGAIAAYAKHFPALGILHIDAHADLRVAYEGFIHSHASIMYNVVTQIPSVIRLVQVGIRDLSEEEKGFIDRSQDRIVLYSMPAVRKALYNGSSFTQLCKEIVRSLPKHVYISFDIDGLDPSLCPNTGTPVPGGLYFPEVTHLLSTLVDSGKTIVGFDLNEVAPSPDQKSEWDGNVAARILYKMIGFTLLSQEPKWA